VFVASGYGTTISEAFAARPAEHRAAYGVKAVE
jgi:hypothetical protein